MSVNVQASMLPKFVDDYLAGCAIVLMMENSRRQKFFFGQHTMFTAEALAGDTTSRACLPLYSIQQSGRGLPQVPMRCGSQRRSQVSRILVGLWCSRSARASN